VLAVYLTGYFRTRSAAQRFEGDPNAGRRSAGSPAGIVATIVPPPAPAAQFSAPVNPPPAPVASTPEPAPLAKPALSPAPAIPPTATVTLAAAAPTPAPVAALAAPPVAPLSVPPAVAVLTAPPVPAAGASAPATAAAKPAEVAQPKWKDGKFSGWGSCRHGEIEATVEIKGGRIVSAYVSQCQTRYSCDVIDKIIPQVVARQSADVDTVSGATQSADAFYWAVTAALASAKPEAAKSI
jgi:uncharacterized protein with FMN-binding domain